MPKDGLEGTQTSLQGFTCICSENICPALRNHSNFISKNGPEFLANLAVVCIENGTKPSDIIISVDMSPARMGPRLHIERDS